MTLDRVEVERRYVADEALELPSLVELTQCLDGGRDRRVAPVAEGDPGVRATHRG